MPLNLASLDLALLQKLSILLILALCFPEPSSGFPIYLAAQYADEINVMKDGRTYALGTPNDVFKSEIIEMAFDCPVHIMRHPHHHCPFVIAASPGTGNVSSS